MCNDTRPPGVWCPVAFSPVFAIKPVPGKKLFGYDATTPVIRPERRALFRANPTNWSIFAGTLLAFLAFTFLSLIE